MGQNRYTPNPRKYNKSNFVELVELITPKVYQSEDLALSGTELNPLSKVINSHINAANNISTVLSISAVANSQTSNLNNISGISQYFVKQNKLTNINPYLFETKILLPLSTTLANYDTSADFDTYLSGTLLPKIRLFQGDSAADSPLWQNIAELSAFTSNNEASSVHNYLVDNLGWMYFLNTSADGGLSYSPSSYVLSSLSRLYLGESINTTDGVKGFTEHIWKNYATCSLFSQYKLIPSDFISGTADSITETSAGALPTYTSGTQRLEALQTLVDVVYSPLYIDQEDFTVETAFQNNIDASLYLDDQTNKGPYRKFTNLLGYNFADLSDEVDNIGLIYDIENVKDGHLQYIADLIGWKLRGNSPSKWRHQLRKAVDIYKRSGTLSGIQTAINTLIVDSVFDVEGKVQELWESYIPHLVWYALGTESPLFKDLTTWTHGLAQDAGVFSYSTSSLDTNIKMVVDSILLNMYNAFPDLFLFHGEKWPVPHMVKLDSLGCVAERYTTIGDPQMKPFHFHQETDPGYQALKHDAFEFEERSEWNAAHCFGPLGSGVYMAGLGHPKTGERPIYLSATGDMDFVFSYRGKENYPIPPFEEVKYYKDCNVTAPLVQFLVDRLKCFLVKDSFADETGNYILSSAVTTSSNLGSLNEFLMFFSGVQVPSNFNDVMLSISNYEKNLLSLWNGKSSHLFLDFESSSFDFAKTTMEGDSQYALVEASRVSREFAPAHAITKVNLTTSSDSYWDGSSTKWEYLGFDKDDTRASYASASVLANFETSGATMSFAAGGGDDDRSSDEGRGGLNTFKRPKVDEITDTLLGGGIAAAALTSVPRRALRRRNFRYTLPKEGYYDRTGFNGPVSWQASTLEYSMASSMGELTLGYVASAGQFYPVVDPVNPSGVWHECEKYDSPRIFSGIETSATFPYRGLSSLGSNVKMPEVASSNAFYVDRGQTPLIYATMHQWFEQKARDYANEQIKLDSSFNTDAYWKDNIQSYANSAIASGLVINSYDDYLNFGFGTGLQKAHRDYCKYFDQHILGLNTRDDTGASIFAQVFGKGLYNCDFDIAGSAAGRLISTTFDHASAINVANVWNETANGTFIASSTGQSVIPLSGTWVSGNVNNADYRNPAILSGIEFCDISGAPARNQFTVFKVDSSAAVAGTENYLVNNSVIKCKSLGGLPRIRFDLSAYGNRRNYFIKDHKFKLSIKGLVGEENSTMLGGGQVGVWIHTEPVSGILWSWTPKGKWEVFNQSRLSLPLVKNTLAHTYTFKTFPPADPVLCLGNTVSTGSETNPGSLKDITSSDFQTFEVDFDTRNYTIHNNFEYLDIIPIENSDYEITEQVNRDDTNYIVEIFFMPNTNYDKYLLIQSIELYDVTQRENTGIGTGHGVATSGIPLRPWVKEDKLYLNKEQLQNILKFYNGLAGQGAGIFATTLASRDATISSETMEVSGGSRLNYRINPIWTPGFTWQQAPSDHRHYDFTNVELDN